MSEQQKKQLQPGTWNRTQVNRCLLPILRYLDSVPESALSDEAREEQRQQALEALCDHPQEYRQLLRVFQKGNEQLLDQWFGWIECEPSLLQQTFAFVEQNLPSDAADASAHKSYDKELYFIRMFQITEDGETVDLAYPFEQYYFCDEVIYQDYLWRRIELGDKCKAWIRHYIPYYTHIRSWYVAHADEAEGISREYTAYMELLDYFMTQIAYEDQLRDERQALEYERGGLGWFHRARKREIDEALFEVARKEFKLKLDSTQEKYDAYAAQYDKQRRAWEDELERVPLTAFGRRRELKQRLMAVQQKIREYRDSIGLDALRADYQKRYKNYGKD